MFDMKITGGYLYIDGKWSEQNLYIKDGKIAKLSREQLEAKRVHDAKGAFVIPGLIDSHVHLACPGDLSSADDFYSGSLAAASGGVTTMIDFLAEAHVPEEVEKFYRLRMADAKDSVIDYGFHCAVRQPENVPEIANICLSYGMPSIKLYTTYRREGIYTDDRHVCEVIKRTSEQDIMMLSHTENDGLLYNEFTEPGSYAMRRPPLCELSETIKLAQMTAYYGGLTYMVHVSCGTTAAELKKRFPELLNRTFILESCPHYFVFDDSAYGGSEGYLFTMTPPLRSPLEQRKLAENFDAIHTLSTDHCPFLKAQKNVPIEDIPMGVGGLGYSFGQMYSLFGESVIDRFTVNQAKTHGLYPSKGILAEGSDADIAIFEPAEPQPCRDIRGKSDYSIYTGCIETVRFKTVISRGEYIVQEGVLNAVKGRGRYQKRKL